jgi:head-tail adaptor
MPSGRPVLAGPSQVPAGRRDRYVRIEQMTQTAGSSQFPVESWTTLTHEYMARRDLRADERFAAAQASAFAETQWHLEYRADMDPEVVDVPKTRRLVYGGRIFDIASASMIGWKQGIELVTLAGRWEAAS